MRVSTSKKGRPVYIEGRLQTRKWQTKEGQDRYTTEIIADQMQMLGGKDSGGASYDGGMDQAGGGYENYNQAPSQGQAKSSSNTQQKAPAGGSSFDDFEDDIPF